MIVRYYQIVVFCNLFWSLKYKWKLSTNNYLDQCSVCPLKIAEAKSIPEEYLKWKTLKRNSTTLKISSSMKRKKKEKMDCINWLFYYLLSKSKELSILESFPTIKKVFMKYNVVQPSSATSERLFSKGKLIITTKRNKLSDSNFSKLLFLHTNKSSELTKPKEKDCGCIIKYKI